MQFPTPADFGIYLGALLDGTSPAQIPQLVGIAKVAASPAADAMNRLVIRVTADLMEQCGYGDKASGLHLKMAAADMSERFEEHRLELVGLITRSLRECRATVKQATSLSDVVHAMGLGLQAGGLAAVGGGALAGAGLWQAQKELKEGDLKAQANEAAADYYNGLTRDLNERLKAQYGYESASGRHRPRLASPSDKLRASAQRKEVEAARRVQEREKVSEMPSTNAAPVPTL